MPLNVDRIKQLAAQGDADLPPLSEQQLAAAAVLIGTDGDERVTRRYVERRAS